MDELSYSVVSFRWDNNNPDAQIEILNRLLCMNIRTIPRSTRRTWYESEKEYKAYLVRINK